MKTLTFNKPGAGTTRLKVSEGGSSVNVGLSAAATLTLDEPGTFVLQDVNNMRLGPSGVLYFSYGDVDKDASYPSLVSSDPGALFDELLELFFLAKPTRPEFENNDDALAGGLQPGQEYRTGDLLKVVHYGEGAEFGIMQRYLRTVGARGAEITAVYKLVTSVKPFWDKIHALYPMIGASIGQRGYNLVNPVAGTEGFKAKTSGVAAADKGITVQQTSTPTTHFFSTGVNPFNVNDYRLLGVAWYCPDNLGGGDWQMASLGDRPSAGLNFFTYHPRYSGSNSYLGMGGNGVVIPAPASTAGLTMLRRDLSNTGYVNIGSETEITADVGFENSGLWDDQYHHPKICMLGHAAMPYTLGVLTVFSGLTSEEAASYRIALNQFISDLNRS